jgi:hypothetical protein
MKLKSLVLLLLFPSFALSAQSGNSSPIYIAPGTGNYEADSRFFDENFAREFAGAGYTVVQNEAQASYRINLHVEDNLEYGEYEDSKLKILNIALVDARNSREIISFAWEFDVPEEMYEWSLDMLYQSIPNQPSVSASPVPVTDPNHWRNKWLYALIYGGTGFTWFLSENIDGAEYTYTGPFLSDGSRKYINTGSNQGGQILPVFGAGAEFQFLNYMSAETGIKFRFNDVEGNKNIPVLAIPLYVKFPLKPGKLFMIEPYIGIELNISTDADAIKPAILSAAGGFQLGVWGGKWGAAFIDTNISFDLGLSEVNGPYGNGTFQRISLGFSVGYKYGFYNRNKDAVAAQPLNSGEYDDAYDYDDEYEDYEDDPGGEEAGDL